jgi:hypothetical protein
MKTSIELDDQLVTELNKTISIVQEKPAAILRMAIRAGLPIVANRFQTPKPEGYFSQDYPLPDDRLKLESAMSKTKQRPDR